MRLKLVLAAAAILAGCGTPDHRGEPCADVGAARACWSGKGPVLVARAVAVASASVGRPRGGGPFACNEQRCLQAWPRLPDDGEWDCVNQDGAVLCRVGAPPAGVVTGPPDPGWICGKRRVGGERLCVDFAPDLPPPERGMSHCSFIREPTLQRLCVRGEGPLLGDPCRGACPRGSTCTGGRCLPSRPAPDCWVDPDCGDDAGASRPARVCNHGTCGPAEAPGG